jgi:hypothetical protein
MCPDKLCLAACPLDTYQCMLIWLMMRWSGNETERVCRHELCRAFALPVWSLLARVILIFSTALVLLDDLPRSLLHGLVNLVSSLHGSNPSASPCHRAGYNCLCISQGTITPMFSYIDRPEQSHPHPSPSTLATAVTVCSPDTRDQGYPVFVSSTMG